MTGNRNVHSLFAWPLSVEGCSMNKRTSHQSLPYLNLLGEIQASFLLNKNNIFYSNTVGFKANIKKMLIKF